MGPPRAGALVALALSALVALALSALVALALSAILASTAAAEGLYLHSIPATSATPAPALGGPLRIRLFVAHPHALADRLPGIVRSIGEDSLEIDLEADAQAQVEPGDPEAYRAATFLVDFDEPEVAALTRELVDRHGPSPSIEALRAFTSEAIPRKTMERGWDFASRVARSGVGDCTEHAVLLAALARSVSLPARVVTGVVVVQGEEDLLAFGHAWTEIHAGGRWTVADATPIADEAKALAYLPILALEDEGPGYAMALGLALQRTWVRSLEVSAAAVPTAAP